MKRMRCAYWFQQQKLKYQKMNHSNDPLLASIKQSKYYHLHKFARPHDSKKKPFDKLDTFAQEAAVPIPSKGKQVGKIRRNSVATSNEASQKTTQKSENAVPQSVLDKWTNDDLITKIRCSQIASRPEKSMQTALKQANFAVVGDKSEVKRNTRSVSSHYEANYESLLREYEKKKEKISHQIQSLRSTQTIKVDKFYETALIPHHNNETPKFGANLSHSQKSIPLKQSKTPSKAGKDTKFASFLNAIKSQVELQTTLRNLKHKVTKQQQQKMKKLLQTQYKIEEDITCLDSDEFDPFADRTERAVEALASELANSYLLAQQNWSSKLKNSFDAALLNEIFSAFESSSEKGTISLKAFVREMGLLLQNQKYLRNRDLYRIHTRIAPFRRDNFLSVLARKQ